MKKILVIGKNGYISKCFQKYMKRFSEYKVDSISVRTEEWKKMDFSIYDVIFNTIGLTHNDARKGTKEEFYWLNTELPYQIAVKAKNEGVKSFIHMSSIIIYGNISRINEGYEINQGTLPNPNSIYGKSKLEGEKKIQKLKDCSFDISIIRSPIVYGEDATDNIAKLINFSTKTFIFPQVKNCLSMIYDENLCELIRIIIEKNGKGIFYPQMEKYICTSDFVKDISRFYENKVFFVKIFNKLIYLLSKKIIILEKVFGNQYYQLDISNHFEGKYRIFNYEESIKKIVNKERRKNEHLDN